MKYFILLCLITFEIFAAKNADDAAGLSISGPSCKEEKDAKKRDGCLKAEQEVKIQFEKKNRLEKKYPILKQLETAIYQCQNKLAFLNEYQKDESIKLSSMFEIIDRSFTKTPIAANHDLQKEIPGIQGLEIGLIHCQKKLEYLEQNRPEVFQKLNNDFKKYFQNQIQDKKVKSVQK